MGLRIKLPQSIETQSKITLKMHNYERLVYFDTAFRVKKIKNMNPSVHRNTEKLGEKIPPIAGTSTLFGLRQHRFSQCYNSLELKQAAHSSPSEWVSVPGSLSVKTSVDARSGAVCI